MLNASLWVLIAFCILILFIGRPAWRALVNYLDQHSFKVRNDLEEAKRLHKEAQDFINDAKRLQMEATHRAQEIISHAKIQAETLQKTSQEELETYIRIEEQLLSERLSHMKAQVLAEIENKALKAALDAAHQNLAKTIQSSEQEHLFTETLDHVKNSPLKSKSS
ncbi:MAG: hypothetical protein J0H12_00495 [Candidatus Paracaedimonas acanthamoebae]|uniref:ATP synthase subunit b n=1 Tax=Candidatus Paracaedimonas acanthamoebae TaxID=244581 RepID=A0A8J7TSI5_9PROT|nr:hypothetical protein [Candidatus Paracaedimonas acanthamoebae]